jgi:4-amino-4-deoxy-L-arabinose transferase-like glycosyltransferase
MKQKRYFPFLILLIISTITWIIYYKIYFIGLLWSDSFDYAQIARNIYLGNGFSTDILRPLSFRYFQYLPHPELIRPPLYPYTLALFFSMFGVNDFSCALSSGIFFILAIPLLYMLGKEMFKRNDIPLLAVIMVLLNKSILELSITCSADMMYTFSIILILYIAIKFKDRIFLLGILLGISYLIRNNTLIFIPVWIIYISEFSIRRTYINIKNIGIFLSGFFIGISPYFIRNLIIIGNPFFTLYKYSILTYTKSFHFFDVWRIINPPSPFKLLISNPSELLGKSIFNICRIIFQISPANIFILLIVLGGILIPVYSKKISNIKMLILGMILIELIIIIPLFLFEMRFIQFLIPELLLFSSYLILKKRVLIPVIIGLLFYISPFYLPIFKGIEKSPNPYIEFGRFVRENTEESDVIASDLSWAISWYGDRKTVWYPLNYNVIKRIDKKLRIDSIVVTSYILLPDKIPKKAPEWIKKKIAERSYEDKRLWLNLLYNPYNLYMNFKVKDTFNFGHIYGKLYIKIP